MRKKINHVIFLSFLLLTFPPSGTMRHGSHSPDALSGVQAFVFKVYFFILCQLSFPSNTSPNPSFDCAPQENTGTSQDEPSTTPMASLPRRTLGLRRTGRLGQVSPFRDDATRLRRHPDAFSRDLEVDGLPVGSRCKNQPRIYPSGTMSRIGANFSFTIRENSRNSWQEITICS